MDEWIYIRVKRQEDYWDVHPEIVFMDFLNCPSAFVSELIENRPSPSQTKTEDDSL